MQKMKSMKMNLILVNLMMITKNYFINWIAWFSKNYFRKKFQNKITKSIFIDDITDKSQINFNYETIIISDPHLCKDNDLKLCKEFFKEFLIKEIFFENNLKKCLKNI